MKEYIRNRSSFLIIRIFNFLHLLLYYFHLIPFPFACDAWIELTIRPCHNFFFVQTTNNEHVVAPLQGTFDECVLLRREEVNRENESRETRKIKRRTLHHSLVILIPTKSPRRLPRKYVTYNEEIIQHHIRYIPSSLRDVYAFTCSITIQYMHIFTPLRRVRPNLLQSAKKGGKLELRTDGRFSENITWI